jgi:hypothetical protein
MNSLQYLPEYQVLICTSCQYAIQPDHIVAHLQSKEHQVSREESKRIATICQKQPLADPCKEPIIPTSIIQPIDHLPIFRDGLACQHCQYVCRSTEVMKRHQRQVHSLKSGRGRRTTATWTSIWCQRFFPGKGTRYFAVASTNQSCSHRPATELEAIVKEVELQLDEKQKIIEKKKQVIMESDNPTEVSSWLERTQWIRHLEGQERAKIAVTADLPIAEEPILQEITKSIEQLIQMAQQTVLQKKVSSFALHRINSFQPNIDKECHGLGP